MLLGRCGNFFPLFYHLSTKRITHSSASCFLSTSKHYIDYSDVHSKLFIEIEIIFDNEKCHLPFSPWLKYKTASPVWENTRKNILRKAFFSLITWFRVLPCGASTRVLQRPLSFGTPMILHWSREWVLWFQFVPGEYTWESKDDSGTSVSYIWCKFKP